MMPRATGGPKPLRTRVDLLFGAIFLVAAARWLFQGWLAGSDVWLTMADSRFWLVGLIGLIFLGALRLPGLRRAEPYVFLAIAVIPFFESPESIFGFGLFAVGAILLLVDGQLSRHPLPKLALLGAYLVVLLVTSALLTRTSIEMALALLLFMVGFFLFLFLTFQDKIIVFVKASKPIVHLSKKGLTDKEAAHLLGLLAGKTMKEIAWENGVKESTIRNSLSRAYRRLGFTDKTQLLQWAETHEIQP